MSESREVRCYEYVTAPYARVRVFSMAGLPGSSPAPRPRQEIALANSWPPWPERGAFRSRVARQGREAACD